MFARNTWHIFDRNWWQNLFQYAWHNYPGMGGTSWNGLSNWRTSVRDKFPQQEEWLWQALIYRSTRDIIKAANEGRLPDNIMMTFHPQRWSDKTLSWIKEMVRKRILVKVRKKGIRWILVPERSVKQVQRVASPPAGGSQTLAPKGLHYAGSDLTASHANRLPAQPTIIHSLNVLPPGLPPTLGSAIRQLAEMQPHSS